MTSTSIGRFFRTPKGLLIVILTVLAAIAAPHEGLRLVAPGLVSAVTIAAAIDAVILRVRRRRWTVPDGAILTAMIAAMVLSAQQAWYVAPVTAVLGVVSKYIVRTRAANVFNPAALALVVTFYVFDTGQSWWGALPNVTPYALPVLIVLGVFIADRVNKMPLVLAFLGAFYLLFTATAFVVEPGRVAEVFRTPDVQAALFFAFIILTDPPTSPVRYPEQLICGVIVAAVSYAAFLWIGAAYYMLAGVLVGNLWEAWRRETWRRRRRMPRAGLERPIAS